MAVCSVRAHADALPVAAVLAPLRLLTNISSLLPLPSLRSFAELLNGPLFRKATARRGFLVFCRLTEFCLLLLTTDPLTLDAPGDNTVLGLRPLLNAVDIL